eukprot:GHVQ01018456.1.p1 GENE.GHVQ01018456.1~~GHVQ01018456.1.p1  ORF type:complete len:213 (+),score=16.15 GHVQ01018456.1:342-980(+)
MELDVSTLAQAEQISDYCLQKYFQSIIIHNVLLSAEFQCGSAATDFNLDALCGHFGNSVYNPEEFHCLRIDVRTSGEDSISVSLFANGKIQCTGGRSIDVSMRTLKKVAKRLRSPPLNIKTSLSNFQVVNILAVFDAGFNISLNKLLRDCRGVEYFPDRFPGARMKVAVPPLISTVGKRRSIGPDNGAEKKDEVVTVNVFSTGKLTVVAARC